VIVKKTTQESIDLIAEHQLARKKDGMRKLANDLQAQAPEFRNHFGA